MHIAFESLAKNDNESMKLVHQINQAYSAK